MPITLYRYIVIPKDSDVFYTQWYSYDNNYSEGMIVVDIVADMFTTDGKTWVEIKGDTL